MAAAKAPTIEKGKIEQTIDLKEAFGVDLSGSRKLKEAIGQAIINKMIERVTGGGGMRFSGDVGRPFNLNSVPYSPEYLNASGKPATPVNLLLTGDMLGDVKIKSIGENSITFGITEGLQKKKAFNHNTGDTLPERPFFGVNNRELREIKSQFGSELREILKTREEEGRNAFNERVASFAEELGDGEG